MPKAESIDIRLRGSTVVLLFPAVPTLTWRMACCAGPSRRRG